MIDEQTKKLVEIRWPARPYSPGMRTIILFVAYLLILQLIKFTQLPGYSYESLSNRQSMLIWNIAFMSHFLTLWGLIMGRAYSRHLLSIWLSIQCLLAFCSITFSIGTQIEVALYESILPVLGYTRYMENFKRGIQFVLVVNLIAMIGVWRVLYPELLRKRFDTWKKAIEKSRYWGVPID